VIIQPKIRGFICTTAHPVGCQRVVQEQMDYVKSQKPILNGPKKVLVIGASTGYGLASRIAAAFGSGAATVGVFFERPAENKRTATAGWYNSVAFEKLAKAQGLYFKSINGDAFSDDIKKQVCDAIKKDLGQVDCVIYSLASPRRINPRTGQIDKSVLKPIGAPYTNKTINFETGEVTTITLESATETEIQQTVSVMGGEDWEMWIDALQKENLLSPKVVTVAYSYIGPELTRTVYRSGTIGAAKDHLEATAHKLDQRLRVKGGRAFVSVNRALITQSSSAIPFIPLYFVMLNKAMKKRGIYEGCIEQIYRLFSQMLYVGTPAPVDKKGRIRIDDLEMRDDVQAEVAAFWKSVSTENVNQVADIEGYHSDFLKLFGFGFSGVNYDADVDPNVKIAS